MTLALTLAEKANARFTALPGVQAFAIGDIRDPGTWMLTFAPNATGAERATALALLGARDMAHAAYVRADDNAEIRELRDLGVRTTEQQARLAELLATSAAIARLIDRYSALIEAPPLPADLPADRHWA